MVHSAGSSTAVPKKEKHGLGGKSESKGEQKQRGKKT